MSLVNIIKCEPQDYHLMVLFCYSTEHLPKKDKVRFYYALKGRDGKTGIVKRCEISHLGRTVLMVPGRHLKEVNDFLGLWKCSFEKKEVFIKK